MCVRKTFYIFRNISDHDEFCAVRQDQPIPMFLDGSKWEYTRVIDTGHDRLLDFDVEDSTDATRENGFYFYRRRRMLSRAA